jgi:hypothetical protein
MKVFIDWNYRIEPKNNHTWKSSDINSCDIIISVNNNKFYNKKCINWLYEPESIISGAYNQALKSKNIIATHRIDSLFQKQLIIPPCFPSWIDEGDRNVYTKNKLVSMIASTKNMCDGHNFRQIVAEKNKNSVDLFGFNRPNVLNKKIDGLKNYMFSVAMENGIYNTYYTEKLLDCFLTGTIPIYWGTLKIKDIFDPDGILFLNSDGTLPEISKEIYETKKQAITNNFELAKKLNYTSSDAIEFMVKQL